MSSASSDALSCEYVPAPVTGSTARNCASSSSASNSRRRYSRIISVELMCVWSLISLKGLVMKLLVFSFMLWILLFIFFIVVRMMIGSFLKCLFLCVYLSIEKLLCSGIIRFSSIRLG